MDDRISQTARPTHQLTRRHLLRRAGLGVAGAATLTALAQIPAAANGHGRGRSGPFDDFRAAMRKLWEDHITWTRLFIVSVIAGLNDLNATTNRLLRNQDDIGDAIKPFYGNDAGEELSTLLREHILGAAALLNAAIAGDDEAFTTARDAWYENADEIAAFLHDLNPRHWPLGDMQSMMRDHLDLTLEEASARLNQAWEADVAAYDRIHEQILGMADMLAEGISAQFPGRVVSRH